MNDKTPPWIDISAPIRSAGMPTWPGSAGVSYHENLSLDHGDHADDRTMSLGLHTGTHIDAPSHFLRPGKSVDQVSLSKMIGACYVADLRGRKSIDAEALESLGLPAQTTRLLFLTDNSENWTAEFNEKFVALSLDGAKWITRHGIELVGNDYLSIQPYGASDEIHRELLRSEVLVLEGLMLEGVQPGPYHLMCLPIKLQGVEAAPARALLFPSGSILDQAKQSND